jgi:hypothetical protein
MTAHSSTSHVLGSATLLFALNVKCYKCNTRSESEFIGLGMQIARRKLANELNPLSKTPLDFISYKKVTYF